MILDFKSRELVNQKAIADDNIRSAAWYCLPLTAVAFLFLPSEPLLQIFVDSGTLGGSDCEKLH